MPAYKITLLLSLICGRRDVGALKIFGLSHRRKKLEVLVGDTSTVHGYGRGATSVLRVSAVRASRL
eukprot:4206354-Pleurochrysis_carterae.AAC.1